MRLTTRWLTRLSLCLATLLLLFGSGRWAQAETGPAITLSGISAQGTRLDGIEVLSWSHNVITAREAGSGLATGRRQYQPLLIRKRIDKSTPLLFRAMGGGDTFPTLRIAINEPGGAKLAMTITLTNAQVVGIATGEDEDCDDLERACTSDGRDDDCDGLMEECVSFIATKIEWSAGGVTYADEWTNNSPPTYFMAINEKGVPAKPKKQVKAAAYRSQIISPRDAASGLPTGKRQHSPFILELPDSSQAPELLDSFLTGRPIERVSVITYDPNGVATGAVSLVGVTVVSMTETRYFLDPQNRPRQTSLYELVYQKIEWLDSNGGVTHEDTWDQQR